MDHVFEETQVEPSMNLEKVLHYRVQRLASKMTLITSREVLAGSGVHVGEWRLLCLLKENGQANHTTISQKLALDPGRTSKLLKATERKELVRRTSDPTDGRASFFELTNNGTDIIDRLWPIANGVANDFHSQFSSDDLMHLNRMLDKAIGYANDRIRENGSS